MKILLLCTAFNSLSQRLFLVLRARGHIVTVELALSPELITGAAEFASPDIIICPFLTSRVPSAVYSKWLTLVVHPGPPGDAGPSALDWVLLGDVGQFDHADAELACINAKLVTPASKFAARSHWGVTVLQAIELFDAGPVWAFDQFELNQHTSRMTKSDLYRGPVTESSVKAVLSAIELVRIVAFQQHGKQVYTPKLTAPEFAQTHCVTSGLPFQGGYTYDRPLLKSSSRDFFQLIKEHGSRVSAEAVVQRIRCGDSQPGVLTRLFGTPLFVYNVSAQTDALPDVLLQRGTSGGPGTILATRDGAVLIEIGADYPIWISHLRRPKAKQSRYLHPKLPATMVLMSMPEHTSRLGLLSVVTEWSAVDGHGANVALPWQRRQGTYQQVWVELEAVGNDGAKIGYIHSEFYNGAFSTSQCEMLLKAIKWTLIQPGLKAVVMLGGTGYFSNGIALNVIEGSPDPSAEGWANISAIDDCVQALLAPSGILTFAAIRGNAAAGGLALATAADIVLCAETAVLNPHYRGIGLYGSEYHTYSWYERCGVDVATGLTRGMMPLSSKEAQKIGLIDHVVDSDGLNSEKLLSDMKQIVRKIMTSRAIDVKQHIGAPWTRPLRHGTIDDQLSLSQYMLRNKLKFLAYIFADENKDHLSIEEHFHRYRKHELDEMTLDFFHPHRSQRFSKRCTAFVRKLVPTATPLRFAQHRRYEGGDWTTPPVQPVRKDEEELDDFDGLGPYPASAAIPRLPVCRPEYIQQIVSRQLDVRPGLARNISLYSTTSTSSSLFSDITPAGPNTPRLLPVDANTTHSKDVMGETEQIYNLAIAPGKQAQTPETVDIISLDCATPPGTHVVSPLSSGTVGNLPVFWSCYYKDT